MRVAHSEKTLETLRLLGCTVSGWGVPDIEWKKVKMKVPTKVTCPTCHGTGQVADEKRRSEGTHPHARFAMQRCPTCPPRRNYPQYGSGEVTKLVEREVELGFYVWKEGTIFGSRFWQKNNQCQLCGKTPITNRAVVEGKDSEGRYHVLWVGEDCARTILGVSAVGTTMEAAATSAADAKLKRSVWREIPKPPKVKKPEKPKLADDAPTKLDFDALLLQNGFDLQYSSCYASRATLTYNFSLTDALYQSYEVILNARFGVTVKPNRYGAKPIVKRKDSQDALQALRDAIPAIRKDAGLAKK
jgi:hypothetical protein